MSATSLMPFLFLICLDLAGYQTAFEHCNHLVVGLRGVRQVNICLGQYGPLPCHDIEANLEEMKSRKRDGTLCSILRELLKETLWHLCPVDPRVDVVHDVVPVVEGVEVLDMLDAVVG